MSKPGIQLFRERLSEKVHATIPKGIVGGFEFTVLQRNLKELARKAMKMCLRVLTESNKSRFDSYSRQEQCIDHIPYYLRDCRVHIFSDNLSRNSCISFLTANCQGLITIFNIFIFRMSLLFCLNVYFADIFMSAQNHIYSETL